MNKTVVDIDLIGYSTIARSLEESIAPKILLDLNKQIQEFVDQGLAEAETPRVEALLSNTGDGAILMFENAGRAHQFGVGLLQVTQNWNTRRNDPLAMRFFRVGIASGALEMQELYGAKEYAGTVIARAVRLQAKAKPCSILIDELTAASLPAELRHLYAGPEEVAGKRDEVFSAYSFAVDQPDRAALGHFLEKMGGLGPMRGPENEKALKREALQMLRSLRAHQYDELIFLMEIPIDRRPPRSLPAAERRAIILDWVGEEKGSLQTFYEDLKAIVEGPKV